MRFFCQGCQKGLSEVPLLIKKITELQRDIEELKSNATGAGIVSSGGIFEELAERERRAKNIIIYDVPESSAKEPEDRIKHDKMEVDKIIKALSDVPAAKIKVFRLGKRKQGEHNERPLKVVMESREQVLRILRNKKRLPKPGKIKSDLTPTQLRHLKDLRDELKSRQNGGEADLTIKYIRGCPQIIKIQKNQ
jgi:hypothetical protein